MGMVIVSHEPADLPPNTRLTVTFKAEADAEREWMTGKEFVALIEHLDFLPEDLDEMGKVIEEGCGRIDHDT